MGNNKFHFNNQTKFVVAGLSIGTIIISAIASIAINDIQNKMDRTYAEFAQLMTGALAVESAEITKNIPLEDKQQILKRHASLLHNQFYSR